MRRKRDNLKLKSFRVRPDVDLRIALVCETLDKTESDFIRESIDNQLLRIQSGSLPLVT
jgi:predicted DNA-binding protein